MRLISSQISYENIEYERQKRWLAIVNKLKIEESIEIDKEYIEKEIILIDDGSTDDSLKILEQFSDRIKIISKSNGGTASALNIGIKNMTGEWFKWLSADDVLYPNAIKELIFEAKKLNFCAII